MKHPHDVIDQMDLDLAMSGVFRAVPLLPDSEKLGRIQVFTDGSAMLERAWHTGVRRQRGEQSSCKRIHRDSMV